MVTTDDMNNARHVLHEVAAHAYGLAMGLQNAAPSLESGPPKSVQYLLETSLYIEKLSKGIEELLLEDASKRNMKI